MVKTIEIKIEKKDDFKLLKKHIKSSHIDETTINELSKNLLGKCNKIVIEYPYYDSDYLSSLYLHYVKKFKNFSKECYRLIIFSNSEYDNNDERIIGIITLHPTYSKSHFGRMYFEPDSFLSGKYNILLTKCKVHLSGSETQLQYFPQLRQEGGLCVCGHVAIWAIIKYYSQWHQYSEKTSGEIAQAVPLLDERKKFTSGIEPSQISNVFSQLGFAPLLRSTSLDCSDDELHEEMFAYLQSGIPLVLIVEKFEHAVAAIGFSDYIAYRNTNSNSDKFPIVKDVDCSSFESDISKIYKKIKNVKSKNGEQCVSVIDSYSFIDSVIVNDDNFFPYKLIKRTPCSKPNKDYSFSDIAGFIVPFYSRIQIDYSDVKIMVNNLIIEAGVEVGWFTEKSSSEEFATIVRRIFLVSNNKYREYLLEQELNENSPQLCNFIRQLELSKFLWVVEISTPDEFLDGTVSGLILFDSTSSLNAKEQALFICGNSLIKYYSNNKYDYTLTENFIKKGTRIALKKFSNNLVNFD